MAPFEANPPFGDGLGDIRQWVSVHWFFGGGGCKQLIDNASSMHGLRVQRPIRHPYRRHKADHGVLDEQWFVRDGRFDPIQQLLDVRGVKFVIFARAQQPFVATPSPRLHELTRVIDEFIR